jgi:hypothetical protein
VDDAGKDDQAQHSEHGGHGEEEDAHVHVHVHQGSEDWQTVGGAIRSCPASESPNTKKRKTKKKTRAGTHCESSATSVYMRF